MKDPNLIPHARPSSSAIFGNDAVVVSNSGSTTLTSQAPQDSADPKPPFSEARRRNPKRWRRRRRAGRGRGQRRIGPRRCRFVDASPVEAGAQPHSHSLRSFSAPDLLVSSSAFECRQWFEYDWGHGLGWGQIGQFASPNNRVVRARYRSLEKEIWLLSNLTISSAEIFWNLEIIHGNPWLIFKRIWSWKFSF